MELAILRHGRAHKRSQWNNADADRPLTPEGAAEVERFCTQIAPFVHAGLVMTSPWERAYQTAVIASRTWGLPVKIAPWLAGEELDPKVVVANLPVELAVLLIGHEPGLSDCVRWLSGGRITLKKAGLCTLSGNYTAGGMTLELLIAPKIGNRLSAAQSA